VCLGVSVSCWVSLNVGGVVGSYPLLSQAPTPVGVELGCDNERLGLSPSVLGG
jgi:hypothetical protein